MAGEIPSSALQDNMVVQSLLGTPLRIKYYESEDMEWRPLKVCSFLLSFYHFLSIVKEKEKKLCLSCAAHVRADPLEPAG